MPLFQAAGTMHHYVHVPKCAGQSVEDYLVARFGPLAFLNNRFGKTPQAERWTKSSPQHAEAAAMVGLFPEGWIESRFAVVRNPLTRFASSYNYYLANLKRIPRLMGPEEWFSEYVGFADRMPHYLDNHLRPQTQMVPDGTTVFKLENGMAPLVAHLDNLAGNKEGPREIGHGHVTHSLDGMEKTALSASFLRDLSTYYAKDFDRFGYDLDEVKSVSVYAVERDSWSAMDLMRLRRRHLRRRLWRASVRLSGRALG
ncbi:sulfotransferase family protein [Octadecabacter sp. CECT 8868]|uniref:sulfotransferase family 2 domain-containing protein n=1 Tax=Octadecabacter algicola TaxID=2909342 RepID=UPI001F2B169D|nr:sulfotransferase family 2 domain-containing protein [Octadecabacter algicola]MCF2906667.1 sulfotransferase family protein [Octadecabacter algicola]